jgi:hypothetical protein
MTFKVLDAGLWSKVEQFGEMSQLFWLSHQHCDKWLLLERVW